MQQLFFFEFQFLEIVRSCQILTSQWNIEWDFTELSPYPYLSLQLFWHLWTPSLCTIFVVQYTPFQKADDVLIFFWWLCENLPLKWQLTQNLLDTSSSGQSLSIDSCVLLFSPSSCYLDLVNCVFFYHVQCTHAWSKTDYLWSSLVARFLSFYGWVFHVKPTGSK